MNLEVAKWDEIQNLLHETHRIWSPGLTREAYILFIWNQVHHHWSRRNYRYLVAKEDGEVVSSCKLYSLEFASRGTVFPVAGIGAVFTPEKKLHHGYAGRMLRELTIQCKDQGYAGLFLFSDIDPDYYRKLDFKAIRCLEFWLDVRHPDAPQTTEKSASIRPLELSDIGLIERHYRRWLRRQAYGVHRTAEYLQFKLAKEIFLHENSSWGWPRLHLITLETAGDTAGYAIVEFADDIMRVLEVVAGESDLTRMWEQICRLTRERDGTRIRGWEALAPSHLPVWYRGRTWGHPMMLPLSPEMHQWSNVVPFQLMELDHI